MGRRPIHLDRRTYRPQRNPSSPRRQPRGPIASPSEIWFREAIYAALSERDLAMPVHEIAHNRIRVPNIKNLRERLSPDPDKPLTQERFGQFLGVSWSTVARWEGGGNPGSQMAKRLFRLDLVLRRLEGLILREDYLAFFDQPNSTLLGARPIELLDNDAASQAVIQLVEGIETGAF